MPAEVKVVLDSISDSGQRITTLQLRYWRAIHAEFMTHRVFSRNASSSRAIPVERMIRAVEEDPAGPIYWGKKQRGMQAGEELNEGQRLQAASLWLDAATAAVSHARKLQDLGLHKQVVNRVLEPFSYISVVVTATNWNNFFAVRMHKDAQPEINDLATKMFMALCESVPSLLPSGRWHLPYADYHTDREAALRHLRKPMIGTCNYQGYWDHDVSDLLLKMSTARCARVSYLTHEGKEPSIEDDLALYNRLVGSSPMHASPAEHQAMPDEVSRHCGGYLMPHLHGNFSGWIQHRQTLSDYASV